jgi:hypothetical protein
MEIHQLLYEKNNILVEREAREKELMLGFREKEKQLTE